MARKGFWIGLGVAVLVSAGLAHEEVTPEQQAARDAQAAAQRKADDAREKRGREVVTAVATIKQQLRDPESMRIDAALANDDASVICIEYGARNGFGGYNREIAVFTGDSGGPATVQKWNKHCTGPLHRVLGPAR